MRDLAHEQNPTFLLRNGQGFDGYNEGLTEYPAVNACIHSFKVGNLVKVVPKMVKK